MWKKSSTAINIISYFQKCNVCRPTSDTFSMSERILHFGGKTTSTPGEKTGYRSTLSSTYRYICFQMPVETCKVGERNSSL